MLNEINVPQISESPNFRSLLTANSTKVVAFNGGEIKIKKLSLKKVFAIQALVKSMETDEASEDAERSIGVLLEVIRSGVIGGENISNEDIQDGDLNSLQALSNQIMAYSGMGAEAGNEKSLTK